MRSYVLPVILCYNRHLYGHTTKQCGRKRCSNCSTYHDESVTNCVLKCFQCNSSEHNSFNKSCKEYERQKEIRIVMFLENLSFSKANQR